MRYTTDVTDYLDGGEERTAAEIYGHVRRATGAPQMDVQRALYGLVKQGRVVWNREMGRSGRYRLQPGDPGNPPIGGPGTRDDGSAGDGGDEKMPVAVLMRVLCSIDESGDYSSFTPDPSSVDALAELLGKGFVEVVVTEKGRKWRARDRKRNAAKAEA